MKMMPSHPDFEELNLLNEMLVVLKNPEMHRNIKNISEMEIRAKIIYIEDAIQMIFDRNNPFFEFINNIG